MDEDEERYNYLLGQLCLCACGTPDLALEWVHIFLKITKEHSITPTLTDEQGVPLNNAIAMLVLNLLDHAGVIEHGGGISASWLTAKGERLLAIFEGSPLTEDEKDDPSAGCCEVANWTKADQQ